MAAEKIETQNNLPPVMLQPGWYWWHYIRATTEDQWAAFHAANMRTLKLRSTFAGDTSRANVVVFEVVGVPLAWTLSGVPSKAPKKANTTLKDLSTSAEFKAPDLAALLTEVGEAAESSGTVLKVLLWGGAAVLLFNVFRWSEPPPRRPREWVRDW